MASAPAFLLLLALGSFLCLHIGFGLPFAPAVAVCLLLSSGWGLVGTTKPNPSSGAVVACLFLIAAIGIGVVSYKTAGSVADAERIETTATVISSRGWGLGAVALVHSRKPSRTFLLKLDGTPPEQGDIISLSGRLRPFERSKTMRTFDEFFYWRAKGAIGYLENPRIARLGSAGGFARWRRLLSERIVETLPPLSAGYMLAITTGEREASVASLHRAAGTSHLLAVSGFHVGIVWALAWMAFRRLRSRLILISLCIWLYVFLSGAAPSALRAAFMIQLLILGRMAGRGKGNSFNTVSMAGVALLLLNPWLFWDVGWRLSMLAVLSITSIADRASASPITKTLWAGALVWLATSLQASWTFGEVPLSGLILNFIALPAFSALYPLAIILSIPALLGLPGGYVLALLPEFFFRRWETLSTNVVYLLPSTVAFSWPFMLAGSAVIVFFFARACGFSQHRALIPATLMPALVALLLSWTI